MCKLISLHLQWTSFHFYIFVAFQFYPQSVCPSGIVFSCSCFNLIKIQPWVRILPFIMSDLECFQTFLINSFKVFSIIKYFLRCNRIANFETNEISYGNIEKKVMQSATATWSSRKFFLSCIRKEFPLSEHEFN